MALSVTIVCVTFSLHDMVPEQIMHIDDEHHQTSPISLAEIPTGVGKKTFENRTVNDAHLRGHFWCRKYGAVKRSVM